MYAQVDKRVTQAQTDLNGIGAALMTLDFMTAEDEFTFRASMRLLAALLVGGNRGIQQTLFKFFHAAHNEIFFSEIRDRLVCRPQTFRGEGWVRERGRRVRSSTP